MRGNEVLNVLVVCAANQCRSRAAEALLRDALKHHSAITIRSAGVDVRAPLPMCSVAEKYVQRLGIDITAYAKVPAQAATPELLAQADLILVADAQVRAGITSLDATARRRTFTMPGAAAAAQVLIGQSLVQRALAAHRSGYSEITELVDGEPHVVAGALQPQNARATAAWLPIEIEAAQGVATHAGTWDIPDAHGAPRDIHAQTLSDTERAMQPIAALLDELDTAIRG